MAVKTGSVPAKAKAAAKPKDAMAFSFADTIAGYVKRYDRNADSFTIETSDGREFTVGLTDTTGAQLVRNLGEPYVDATAQMRDMLVPGRYLFTYGIFYPEGGTHVYDAKHARRSRAPMPTTSSSRSRTGGSSRSTRWPTSTTARSSATASRTGASTGSAST